MSNLTHVQEGLADLLRRVEVTSKARYIAARRMELHDTFSQWTLAYLAVGQVVISLVVALKLKSNYSSAYMDFGGLFFGVLVLTYSLLLGMGNFAARAIMLHACGIELGSLARKLHIKVKNPNATDTDYEAATDTYYEILARCENHIALDYLTARSDSVVKKLEGTPFFSAEHLHISIQNIKVFIKIKIYQLFQFAHYYVTVGLMSAWIYKMVV